MNQCPSCLHAYDDRLRRPLVAVCGHRRCCKCSSSPCAVCPSNNNIHLAKGSTTAQRNANQLTFGTATVIEGEEWPPVDVLLSFLLGGALTILTIFSVHLRSNMGNYLPWSSTRFAKHALVSSNRVFLLQPLSLRRRPQKEFLCLRSRRTFFICVIVADEKVKEKSGNLVIQRISHEGCCVGCETGIEQI
ncbi:hypothetical protein CAPTEDRAFT_200086 [Capitella teleta]|uniref:Uncharacterized protein n=1 Tax=Capitella teleta TaxID=283909 RepID=R7UYS7_CAPTE|nr:hypothetical protein CAPTEDRAFT_200086 [Capitella teleta]|eukprot:ELU09082.1 hypothetical protein CAPTEDRAFT_200086 [Capitella teleta]